MRSTAYLAALAAAGAVDGAVIRKQDMQTDRAAVSGAMIRRQDTQTDRAAAVKQTFQIGWDGYVQYAFGHDALKPVSNGHDDGFGGWGATAVDALSTAILMENREIVATILEYIPTIDFTTSPYTISLFETTIRYLGGLLSGYELLKGPFADLATSDAAVDAILRQAVSLADSLSFAFDTPSGIPYNGLDLKNRVVIGNPTNGLATTGTLILEWTRLSDLTGNSTYAELVRKAESHLLDPSPPSAEPFPGLVGSDLNITTGAFLNSEGGWIGGSDSFYEYLIKMYAYDTSAYGDLRDRWILAADSTIANLSSHPSTRPDLTYVAQYDGTDLVYRSEHLACFDGGNFILAGLVLNSQSYIDYGLALVNGCENTYNSTLTGIGPEVFEWTPSPNYTSIVPSNQLSFYERAGFWITNANYILRPEVLESFYYAYRATGDQKYRDWAWNGYVNINATCRTGSGYAEIRNVNAEGGGSFGDLQDSFFFAEVLKYAYLIQVDDAVLGTGVEVQVEEGGVNRWVFNTEAHPVRVKGTPV